MKNINKTTLVTAVAVAAVAIAPQMAVAKGKTKAVAASSSSSHSALESRLEQMEAELQSLRAEVAKNRAESKAAVRETAAQVQAQDQKVEAKLAEAEKHEASHHDLLFFRGGYGHMNHARTGELLTRNALFGGNNQKDGDGWYVGAGFDHRLTDDLWGLSDIAAVDGEVMFEYKNFGSSYNGFVSGSVPLLTGGAIPASAIKNQVTQFTLTASPKIKFNQFGNFRPWIIPFGLGIHVISPPSSGVTVLNPGLMVGTGAEYKIWQDLYGGVDFRYHFTGNDLSYKTTSGLPLKGVNTDGFTTGAYLGFGF